MSLAGMETLTGLRALTYKPGMKPWHRVQAATTALAQALPNLQHLTSLQLEDDVACDAVLLSIGSCTRLEQLTVRGACCSAEGLQQLPTSLTQLLLCWGKGQPGCVVTISPSTTPRLCQLAALHHMHISGEGVQSFDTAVLDGLTSLASMALSLQRFTASPGQHRFQALAAQKLPCLSQVTLTCEDMGVWLAQEASALTAAAQSSLTALHLQGAMLMLDKQTYAAMFPAGVQLRGLRSLMVGVGVLGHPDVMQQLVNCCANLTCLSLSNPMDAENDVAESAAVAHSLWALTRLDCLQDLYIGDSAMEFQREAYKALAKLPNSVTNLRLFLRQNYSLDGLLELTSCRGLRLLKVLYLDDEMDSQVVDLYEVSNGCANVGPQLPQRLCQVAQALLSTDPSHAALHCCMRTIQAVAALEMNALQHMVLLQAADQQRLEAMLNQQRGQLNIQRELLDNQQYLLKKQQEHYTQGLAAQERAYELQLGSVSRAADQQQLALLLREVAELRSLKQEVAALKAALQGVLGRKL